ncbi:MAG TPA: hypothetical protein VGF71_02200 [Caulobacteraceae bacterium]
MLKRKRNQSKTGGIAKQMTTFGVALQYAAHGGLVVYAKNETGDAAGFHSTLTLGAVRYTYYIRLEPSGLSELRMMHPEFNDWCRSQAQEAANSPLNELQLLQLGLAAEKPA